MRIESRAALRGVASMGAALLLAATSVAFAASSAPAQAPPPPLSAAEAIQLANERAPEPVSGTFLLTIKASGRVRQVAFLNTEEDYRDPRSVSVELVFDVYRNLRKRLGGKPGDVLIGKTVLITGDVRRVPIYLTDRSNVRRMHARQPPLPAYYQTHVFVRNADDLQVVEPPVAP
jgi:hypothetical protein